MFQPDRQPFAFLPHGPHQRRKLGKPCESVPYAFMDLSGFGQNGRAIPGRKIHGFGPMGRHPPVPPVNDRHQEVFLVEGSRYMHALTPHLFQKLTGHPKKPEFNASLPQFFQLPAGDIPPGSRLPGLALQIVQAILSLRDRRPQANRLPCGIHGSHVHFLHSVAQGSQDAHGPVQLLHLTEHILAAFDRSGGYGLEVHETQLPQGIQEPVPFGSSHDDIRLYHFNNHGNSLPSGRSCSHVHVPFSPAWPWPFSPVRRLRSWHLPGQCECGGYSPGFRE